MIVCDALRARNLPEWGYHRMTAPNITKMCESSDVYRNAFSHFNYTTPSVATILTGEHYHKHGIWKLVIDPDDPIPEKLFAKPISDVLREKWGYTSIMINEVFPNVFDKAGIIGSHFDVNEHRYGAGAGSFFRKSQIPVYPTAEETTDVALKNMEKMDGDQFFMYVHYWEPHSPRSEKSKQFLYQFHDEEVGKIPIQPYLQSTETDYSRQWVNEYLGEEVVKKNNLRYLLDWYDADIFYMDEQIGRLLDAVQYYGDGQEVTVILTADHAEAMGEHGKWFAHNEASLFQEVMHVPLIVKRPFGHRRTFFNYVENREAFKVMENPTYKHPLTSDEIYMVCRDSEFGIEDAIICPVSEHKVTIRHFQGERWAYNLRSDYEEKHPFNPEDDSHTRHWMFKLEDYTALVPPKRVDDLTDT